MLVSLPGFPSMVNVAFAGNVEVVATMKLPFTVKVGLEPLLKVAVPVLEKEPMLTLLSG